jgi:choline dehydrogenase-like flavoprotein
VDPENRSRSYSATGYYKPIASRKNLTVLTEAVVQEIKLEEIDGTFVATGAIFSHDGARHHVHAAKEVILCAGSVQSPQILELSGIGNPDILQAAGILVKVSNKNVGENLQDHMSKLCSCTFQVKHISDAADMG